jgi:hypothetical protein
VLVAVPAISNGAAAHESRQLPSWLIFDVRRRKMKITSQKPLHRFISIMIAALIAWAIVHFGILAGLKKEPIQQPQQQRP